MIPQRLTLKNFLSYREASLDFRELHVACICGANGAGKSSLLEAIAWVVWGQSRAATEDDVIHMSAQEALVDFTFTCNQQTYRIIRSRYRGQTTTLEFQVMQEAGSRRQKVGVGSQKSGVRSQESESILDPSHSPHPPPIPFRSLTAKGVRATQQLILDHVKLDYETFINSAYLRQGRADEFMLKRPGERKEILADLLKLGQYDELTERAKDKTRQLKGQIELLERNLETIQAQLQQGDQIQQERETLESVLAELQQQQQEDSQQLQTFQAIQHQRQTWQQQLIWQHQQQQVLEQDCQRLQQELAATQQQQQALEALLGQETEIVAGYHYFQTLQTQEERLADKFKTYQQVQTQRQQYQQQQADAIANLQASLQHGQAQLDMLLQQKAEIQHSLSKAAEVATALEQLQQARAHLESLDRLQAQAAPLLQRRQQLQTQLDRVHTRLTTHLEELRSSSDQLQTQQQRQPKLQQAVLEVRDRIETLEQRRLYQQQVLEKGLERRNFMERLQSDQRNYETQLVGVEQKIQLLANGISPHPPTPHPPAPHPPTLPFTPTLPLSHPYPPCPLCDRPLDEHHWQLVMEKHRIQRQDILDQIWVVREQLAASEREIQILRQEYRDLDQELAQYDTALERRGQLQEQLQVTAEVQNTLQQITTEAQQIERSLQTGTYATELQDELSRLDASLHQLNYDEKNHALARGDVDRWRWAEIKQVEIKQAQRRQSQIDQRQPELEAEIFTLQHQFSQLQQETTANLAAVDQHITTLGYDPEQHNELRRSLRQSQPWQLRYQELGQAQQQQPQVQQRAEHLAQMVQERQQGWQSTQTQIDHLSLQLSQKPDCQPQIQALEQQLQQRRLLLDDTLSKLGRLQQQQQHLEALSHQFAGLNAQIQTTQRQYRVYQELSQAFGKNGIQALMIENALPQLETETNQILSRLSANQLHVQFVTQKSNRRQVAHPKSSVKNIKLIETLDILIADAQGTRPYETYSGGEAFRVNFAIRLALARMLAHRSGTALQMLIIDEGFGTQDAEGCDRLIASINAISADFACILAVTHVPHFKEAFQSRIEVHKTEHGSQIVLFV